MNTNLPAHRHEQNMLQPKQAAELPAAVLEWLEQQQPNGSAASTELSAEMIATGYLEQLRELIARCAEDHISISCSLRVTVIEED